MYMQPANQQMANGPHLHLHLIENGLGGGKAVIDKGINVCSLSYNTKGGDRIAE